MNLKTMVAALCLSTCGVAFSATPGAECALCATNAPGLTRAEVLADLALWTRARLPQHVHNASGPDLLSPLDRQAQASHLQWRHSADYAVQVRRIGAAVAERATLAGGG